MSKTRSVTDTKDLVERFATELRLWWSFDDGQIHTHSWHTREDFIKDKLPALLADALSAKDREIAFWKAADNAKFEAYCAATERAQDLRSQLSTAHLSGEKAGLERAAKITEAWHSPYGGPRDFEVKQAIAAAIRSLHPSDNNAASGWRTDMENAPRDGAKFWGLCDEDAIAMFWHPEFGFVSSYRRMTCAPGYTFNDKASLDHSPVKHSPEAWMPIPQPPASKAEAD